MCKGEDFIQLIFGHDLFHLQLMNIDTFISVYVAHCSFLFCLWISTEAKRKLGIDEKQTVKVEDDGTESKSRVRERGICQDLLPPHLRGLAGFCRAFKTNPRRCPGGRPPGKLLISA